MDVTPNLNDVKNLLEDEQAATSSENSQKAEDACIPSVPTLSDADADPCTDGGENADPSVDAGENAGPSTDADGDAGQTTDASGNAVPSIDAGVAAGLSKNMNVDVDEPHEGDKKPPDDGMKFENIKEVKEGDGDTAEKGEVEGETNADTAEGKGGSTANDENQIEHAEQTEQVDSSPLTFYQNDQKFGNTMAALKAQREEGKFCDTILLAGVNEFKVHSCVLAANSSYFDLLLNATIEHGSQNGERKILFPACDTKVAKLLIDYMYTGYLGVNMTSVGQIINTSRQLGMEDVVQCCTLHLLNQLCVSTWAQIYNIAKLNQLDELRSDLHKYIAKNFTTVCKSKGFLSIEFDDIKEIFGECSSMKGIDLTQYQFCAMLSWVAARYADRVDHYSQLSGLIELERLDTGFVTAALNSEQIFNTGLIDHYCSIEILEKLAVQEANQSKKKGWKSTRPTRVTEETLPKQISSSCDTSHDPGEDDEHSDLEMSCEDVTADYPADTSAGIYDAGSYDRMMGDQDADEEDAEIKNKPLSRLKPQTPTTRKRASTSGQTPPAKRKKPEIIKVAQLPRDETPKKKTSPKTPGKQKSWATKETWIQCEWPGCTSVYSSRRKTDLEDHMNSHNGLKPHECSVCGKSFSARKHRQRHEKIHLEVPPIACSVEGCTFRTTRGDKLRDHMQRTHKKVL